MFVQYEFDKQWQALKNYAHQCGIEIIGDVPIYVALDSCDVWANTKLFQLDKELKLIKVAGCPPDAFCEEGQLWGNPLYNYKIMKTDHYNGGRIELKKQPNYMMSLESIILEVLNRIMRFHQEIKLLKW